MTHLPSPKGFRLLSPLLSVAALGGLISVSPAQAMTEYSFVNTSFTDTINQNTGSGTLTGSFFVPSSFSNVTSSATANVTSTFTFDAGEPPAGSHFRFYPPFNPNLSSQTQTLFFNTVYTTQNAFNGTYTELVFTCIGGSAAGCTPNVAYSQGPNNIPADASPSKYQLLLRFAGNLVDAPPATITLSENLNLGNTDQICADFGTLGQNNCDNGENSRIEIAFAEGSQVQVPAPLPVLGAATAFGWSRRLRKKIRKATQDEAVIA